MKTNPYLVLGLAPTASDTEVRHRYRRLVAESHPDKHAGSPLAEARLKDLNAAYAELADPTRRAALDERMRAETIVRVTPAPTPMPSPIEEWIKAVDSPTVKMWMKAARSLTEDTPPLVQFLAVAAGAYAGIRIDAQRPR